MNAPTTFRDDGDDAAKAAALAKVLERHAAHQTFLKEQRKPFFHPANPDHPDTNELLAIYRNVLVGPPHFAPVYELALTAKMIGRLGLGRVPAAYAFGGYQQDDFKLPTGETTTTVKIKLMTHVLACAEPSLVLQGLEKPTAPIPWEKVAASHDLLKTAQRPDDSWDKALLKKLAAEAKAPEERAIKALIHKNGPWLIWFRPAPGHWLDNWLECYGFIQAFTYLDDSIRFHFTPYLFAVFPIDPRKAAPPASAPSTTTTPPVSVTPPVTTPAPPHDDPPNPDPDPVYL